MAILREDSRSLSPMDTDQEKLRLLKDEVKMMENRVQGFVRALNQVLDDDEDLALMNLSRLITHPERFIQPVSDDILHEESDEPELILEAFLQQGLSTVNALELLKSQIATTEELVSMKLDAVRNRLLLVNTIVTVLGLCVACASLVGSIFGMNVPNGLEQSDSAFAMIVASTVLGSCMFLMALFVAFWKAFTVPARQVNMSFHTAMHRHVS
mmetsp:Transcript_32504/g.49726  ORF Transcript_32504/g.49726 Transcript_32504/m.49726 type:complete len:212 (+) Transcript_32504:1-636(+)